MFVEKFPGYMCVVHVHVLDIKMSRYIHVDVYCIDFLHEYRKKRNNSEHFLVTCVWCMY